MRGRTIEREGIEMTARVRLLEGDMDRTDRVLEALNVRMGKILWAMVGLLISVATTCIVILITAGVGQ